VAHRFSVGHDDERPAGEAEVDELLEALLRPDGLAHQAQRGLLLRRRPGPLHAPREPRHLARQRAEDVGVGHVGWRHVAPGAEALRPLRHLRHRLRDAAPHDDQRDERDDERQSEEPERVAPPEVPRRALQVRGVEDHHERAHRPVVPRERRRVHVRPPDTHDAKALAHDVVGDRVGHFGERRWEGRRDVGRRDHQAGEPVVHRDPAPRRPELLQYSLDARRRVARHLGLDRLLEPLAHEDRAALQVVDEPLALLADLQEREPPDDDQHREPDGPDQTNREFHDGRCVLTSA